jgi:RNA polymerase sigma factor (sigma-70 family)
MEHSESEMIIHNLIDNLPEAYKTIIRFRDIEELPFEEIAEKTGQNINTIRVSLSRARRFVRDEYNKYQNEYKRIREVNR